MLPKKTVEIIEWNFRNLNTGSAGLTLTSSLFNITPNSLYKLKSFWASVNRFSLAGQVTLLGGQVEFGAVIGNDFVFNTPDPGLAVVAPTVNQQIGISAIFDTESSPLHLFQNVTLMPGKQYQFSVTYYAPAGAAFIASDVIGGDFQFVLEQYPAQQISF